MLKICIYARVSTAGQELDHQIQACKRYCDYKALEYSDVDIYTDIGSGAKFTRPQYLKMIKCLRSGFYDGVVVQRLDRLGRRARDLSLIIDELEDRGIKVLSVQENFDTSTAIGRAMRSIILIMAGLERENISEATKQRLDTLKAAGKQLGRPKISRKKKEEVQLLHIQGMNYRQIKDKTRLSIGTITNILRGNANDTKS